MLNEAFIKLNVGIVEILLLVFVTNHHVPDHGKNDKTQTHKTVYVHA